MVRDSFGKVDYLAQCEALCVTPVAQIVRYLEHEELHLAHYGIGGKGLQALLAALKVYRNSVAALHLLALHRMPQACISRAGCAAAYTAATPATANATVAG